jgi:chloramphenicol O-acetyltransferase
MEKNENRTFRYSSLKNIMDDFFRVSLELDPVNAYRILKGHGYNVTLNLVYAIQGALLNMHWNKLPVSLKEKLKSQLMDRC